MRRAAIMMIIVGALIFALTAATAMAAPGKAKVVMCHKGQTITVGGPSVKGHHQKHGDTPGACAATTAPAPVTEPASAA